MLLTYSMLRIYNLGEQLYFEFYGIPFQVHILFKNSVILNNLKKSVNDKKSSVHCFAVTGKKLRLRMYTSLLLLKTVHFTIDSYNFFLYGIKCFHIETMRFCSSK